DKTVSISEVQLKSGLITEVDLRLMINRKREQELLISEERLNLMNMTEILARRLHISEVNISGQEPVMFNLKELSFYLENLEKNCDYNIQELRLNQSRINSDRVKADRGPYLSFYTQYGLRSDELFSTETGWIVGLTLTQDIFNGSVKKQRLREAMSRTMIQEKILEEVREKNEVLVREQYRRSSEIFARLSIIEERVLIYRDKVDIDRHKLEQGNISQIEFLRTLTEYNSQQIEYELRRIEYLQSYFELIYLCGLAEEFFGGE
ncbi:MAG TPA: hypothetical protein ENN73_07005, partial [Firmicutes bacterium]|nr:hypothetical protein [Bacillota bacterium]